MVEWSKFTLSGSLSGSNDMSLAGLDKMAPSTFGSMSSGDGLDALGRKSASRILNQDYIDRIKEIRLLAMKFDPTMDAVKKVQEILNDYESTGILTKNEMKALNRMYNVFSFEAKYHPDKATTIGVINEILGGLNEYEI